jgi:hypothetical protein
MPTTLSTAKIGMAMVGCRLPGRAWAPERYPDLTQVMFVMSGDLIEFIPQRAHAVHAVHELEMAAALIVHARIIDDGVANRFIDAPGDIEWHARIVETPSPCILIHHP